MVDLHGWYYKLRRHPENETGNPSTILVGTMRRSYGSATGFCNGSRAGTDCDTRVIESIGLCFEFPDLKNDRIEPVISYFSNKSDELRGASHSDHMDFDPSHFGRYCWMLLSLFTGVVHRPKLCETEDE